MRVALLVGWVVVLGVFGALSPDDALVYAIGGVPLTIAVGWLVNRWWVGWVPLATSVILIAGAWFVTGCASDGDCGGDDGFSIVIYVTGLFFTLPATLLLLLGVAARRAKDARVLRGPDEPLHR